MKEEEREEGREWWTRCVSQISDSSIAECKSTVCLFQHLRMQFDNIYISARIRRNVKGTREWNIYGDGIRSLVGYASLPSPYSLGFASIDDSRHCIN